MAIQVKTLPNVSTVRLNYNGCDNLASAQLLPETAANLFEKFLES